MMSATVDQERKQEEKLEIVWRNVAYMGYFHIAGVYGLYLWLTGQVKWWTIALNMACAYAALIGVTAGAHRLWSHKCYKAKLPLSILLCVFQTMASQNSIYEWSRDHRVHHKYTETNADPHNVKRGFFFAHVGWLLVRKHGAVKNKGKDIFMNDLENDAVVMFQKKYFIWLTLLLCFLIPWYIPVAFGEDGWKSWNSVLARYIVTLNITWLVNSAAHLWGHKPYDKNINPVENKVVSLLAVGEGWHNYHHTFPWDYKAAELPTYSFNWTTAFIDLFAKIGWAYDLKTVPMKLVVQRSLRTGDGSHQSHDFSLNEEGNNDTSKAKITEPTDDNAKKCCDQEEIKHAWGWGDEDVSKGDQDIYAALSTLNL